MFFVTGGTGLVGSFLLAEMRQRGLAVRALHRGPVPEAVLALAPGVEWVPGDLLDTELLRQCLGTDVTHVFHCAGLVSYAPQDEDLLLTTNVLGTAAVVDACLARPGIRLAHVSSAAALGGGAGSRAAQLKPGQTLVLDEDATWDLGAAHGAYATSKYLGELEVWRGVAEGLAAVIVNPTVVLGPGDPARSSTRLLRYAAAEHWFYTTGLLHLVDVRDVAAHLLHLALHPPEGPPQRYVLSAETRPVGEFLALAATAFGKRPPAVAVPDWAAEVIWRLEHLRSLVTGARPLITKDTARAGRRPVNYDGRKVVAATGLGYRPLADTVAWAVAGLR